MRFLGVICLLFTFNVLANQHAKHEVFLYTYHNKPPFITELSSYSGLYFDLAKALTSSSKKYQFTTVYLPRKRLDFMIQNGQLDGIVLGASPSWFNDKLEKRYLWTKGFYRDRDEFISLKSSPFEFENQLSFIDKTVVCVAGFYYSGINESVKSGKLTRINTVGEKEVLQLLEKKRANFGLVSRSVLKFLQKIKSVGDVYHLSSKPHDSFDRKAFTTKNNQLIYNEFVILLEKVLNSGQWQNIISQYE